MQNSGYVNIRPLPQSRQRYSQPPTPKKRRSIFSTALALIVSAVVVWAGVAIAGISQANADAPIPEIRSGIAGYCIDDYHNAVKPASPIDAWSCNGTAAQMLSFNGTKIEKDSKYCLDVAPSKVVLNKCNSSKSQSWYMSGAGITNLSNGQCLTLPGGKTKQQLITAVCNQTSINQVWVPSQWSGRPLSQTSDPQCGQKNLGQRVACVAQREWLAWQTEPKLHKALLNDYTDGNPSEEWCADFVSFVYQAAGAPFTNGERSGWDEYNANNIQYQGFTYHDASSGYVPKPGDVAYFNYSGGHVEIVVSGGKHPTFIYGDSGTIDPISGNGDMAENQITSDGSAGQLVYYLSPNPGV